MIARVLTYVLLSFILSACFHQKQTEKETFHLSLTPSHTLIWAIGNTTRLRASVVNQHDEAAKAQPTPSFVSADPAIATVDSEGLVTAVAVGETTISVSAGDYTASAAITVNTDVLVLSGKVQYQDREYNKNGFTGNQAYQLVRYAIVDLLDSNNNIVQTTVTDANGDYSFGFTSDGSYRVRVLAQTDIGSGLDISVANHSGAVYSVSKSLDLADSASANLNISYASGVAGPFNILDVFLSAGEMTLSYLPGVNLPALSAFWAERQGAGTYYCEYYDGTYCKQGEGIYIYNAGSTGDTDEFDDDVIWHEYSHYLAAKISKDNSPGGCHILSSNDLDLRLSWSEGWGDYFPAAMKSWLAADMGRASRLSIDATTVESIYVDTAGTSAQIAVDIALPGGSPYVYASNELAVAKILWGVQQQVGLAQLLQVMNGYLPGVSQAVSLENFWDGLLAVVSPDATLLTNLETVFADRLVYYVEDSYEANNDKASAGSLSLDLAQTHFLYRSDGNPDKDVFALNVTAGQSYQVKTYGLYNGIDTYLKLVNSGGEQLAENDDKDASGYQRYDGFCGTTRVHNDTYSLASEINFTASASETLYIEASTTSDPVPYPSAGRYGTYSIKFTQP